MKKHLRQLPTRPSNWKDHPSDTQWEIVDWNGEFFVKHKALIPKGSGGCCTYPGSAPLLIDGTSAPCVKVRADLALELTTLGFKNNAWRKPSCGQCDAILFPTSDTKSDAFLLVETKYSEKDDALEIYKNLAVKQITDTISQLSDRGCPIAERNLFGLISCPLLSTVGASVFSASELSKIYQEHRVQIHVGNTATFQDAQSISFIK